MSASGRSIGPQAYCRRRSGAAARSQCGRAVRARALAGMSPAAMTAAMESYLPVVCVLYLTVEAFPAQRERLIQRIEVALRSVD